MKIRLMTTALVICAVACQTSNTSKGSSKLDKNRPVIENSIGHPKSVESTGILVYPLTGSFDYGKARSYKRGREYDYQSLTWNLVFFDLNTGEKHLLVEDKVIRVNGYQYEAKNPSSEGMGSITPRNNRLYYELTMNDLNGDSLLDRNDLNQVYSSDTAGKNLKRISPENMNVVSWRFVDRQDTWIEFRGRFNNNKDSILDDDDPFSILHVNVHDETVREVFSPKDQEALFKIYESSIPKGQD